MRRFGRRSGARSGGQSEASDDAEAARRAALAMLGRREFCSAELKTRLGEKGFTPGVSDAVIAELQDERLLDDSRYLEQFVRVHAGRGQGPTRIRQELSSVGVRGDLVDQALDEGPDFVALCREVRVRKFGSAPPDDWKEKSRQARFLQYRGFSSDHIRSALGQDLDTAE
jgi:regulatory protein